MRTLGGAIENTHYNYKKVSKTPFFCLQATVVLQAQQRDLHNNQVKHLQMKMTLFHQEQDNVSGFEEPTTATKDLEVGDYILAKFQPKKQTAIHYVGKVISKEDSMWTVTYYRKTTVPNNRGSATVLAFTEPFRKDVFETSDDAIVMKLRLKEAYKKVLLFENIFEDRIIR